MNRKLWKRREFLWKTSQSCLALMVAGRTAKLAIASPGMEGALESGERVASELLARIRNKS